MKACWKKNKACIVRTDTGFFVFILDVSYLDRVESRQPAHRFYKTLQFTAEQLVNSHPILVDSSFAADRSKIMAFKLYKCMLHVN